jgi:hypothetical protein
LTGALPTPINLRNESSGGHNDAQYYYRTGKGSDATSALMGPQGKRPDMALRGPFLLREFKGKRA